MANKKARYRTKNENGSYDVNWFETCGEQVLFDDGTNAEDKKAKWDGYEVLHTLTHTKSGTVHALTGLSGAEGMVSCQFKATAAFSAGDTFTVDGTPYAVKLTNGEAAEDNLFVSGAAVSCIVDAAGKTVNFKAGGGGYKKGDVLAPENIEVTYRSPSDTDYTAAMFGDPSGIADNILNMKAISFSQVAVISGSTLKIFDLQKGAVTCSLTVRSGSSGYPIAVAEDKKTVYTLSSGYVQKHDISAKKTIWTKQISVIDSGGTASGGIVCYQGKIYVLCDIKQSVWDDSHTFELSVIDTNGAVVSKGTFKTSNEYYGNQVQMHIYNDTIGVLEKTGTIHYLNLQCAETSSAALSGIDSNYETTFYKDAILSLYDPYLKKYEFGGNGSEIADLYESGMNSIVSVWDDVVVISFNDSSNSGGVKNYKMSDLRGSGKLYANTVNIRYSYGYGISEISTYSSDGVPFLCRLTSTAVEYRIIK